MQVRYLYISDSGILYCINKSQTFWSLFPFSRIDRSTRTLKRISLSQNKLIGWKENVFQNLSELTHLDIGLNKIAIFNRTSVPTNILNNLKTLNLAYNPFDCGCDMIWFKNWCLKTNVTLLLFPGMYTCQTPASMLRQPMTSLTLSEEDCRQKNPWIDQLTLFQLKRSSPQEKVH